MAPATVDQDALAAHKADSLRAALLARAGWSEGRDSCDAGSLRAFPGDTTASASNATREIVEGLETLVVTYGLDAPLETPAGRDLLATIVRWEGNGERPRWDVAAGERADRRAIAPGLGGRYLNVARRRCESYVPTDTATLVLPTVAGFTPPRVRGVRLGVIVGDSALSRARAAFFAAPGPRGDAAGAAFSYARVAPVVLWGDYAVVTVNHVAEHRDSSGDAQPAVGNATYLFRRVGGEWRLLAIARTW